MKMPMKMSTKFKCAIALRRYYPITYNIGQVTRQIGDDLRRAHKDIMTIYSASVVVIVLFKFEVLNNFGCLSYHCGDLSKAKEVLALAHDQAKEVHGPQHLSVALALNCVVVCIIIQNMNK